MCTVKDRSTKEGDVTKVFVIQSMHVSWFRFERVVCPYGRRSFDEGRVGGDNADSEDA